MTTTNKTDQHVPRQIGSRYTLSELAAMQSQDTESRRSPSSGMEKRLHILIPPATPSSVDYIAFRESRKPESLNYWSNHLQDWSYPYNLCRPGMGITRSINDRLSLRHTISLPSSFTWPDDGNDNGISPATHFYASFAFALSRFFGARKLLFGRLVTGRSALSTALQNVVEPTMTELPVCVFVPGYNTVNSIAKRLREQFIEDSKYETVGMREIITGATDWDWEGVEGKERDFGWRTAYQQEDETGSNNEEERDGVGFFESKGVGFFERELPAEERPQLYATPDRTTGVLVLEFEGSKEWAREMGVGKEGIWRFLEVLGCVLGGDLGPHVR